MQIPPPPSFLSLFVKLSVYRSPPQYCKLQNSTIYEKMHIFSTVWSKAAPRFKSFLRTLTNNQIVSTEKCTVRFVCLSYSMERDGSKKPHRISKFTQSRKKNVNKTNIRIRNGDRGNWLTLHNMLCIRIWLLVMWFSVLGKWAPFLWLFVWLVGYACAKKWLFVFSVQPTFRRSKWSSLTSWIKRMMRRIWARTWIG